MDWKVHSVQQSRISVVGKILHFVYCRNVKAKYSQRDLESTLVEVDDKENLLVSVSNVPFFCPLPAANYKSGTVSEENLVVVTGPEYAYIPEAYGAVSARVTKHVVRVEG